MRGRPPRPNRTYTLFPYTTPFRSARRLSSGPLSGRALGTVEPGLPDAMGLAGDVQPDAGDHHRDEAEEPDLERSTPVARLLGLLTRVRSEEHTSELQSLMRISYAVFCLKKKKYQYRHENNNAKTEKQ